MTSPSAKTLLQLFRLWAIVLVTNLLGTFLFALVCSRTTLFPPDVKAVFFHMGHETMGTSFSNTFLRAIFGGWLIALIGWILGGFRGDGVGIVFLLSYLVGLGKFSHIVAGSVDTLYLVLSGGAKWTEYFHGFMFPTLLGNTVGGVALVALLNHAQATAGRWPRNRAH